MGLIRKTASISTLGIIKFRSNGEQTRRLAKQTRNATRAQVVQNQVLIATQRAQLEAQIQANAYQMARDIAPIQQPMPFPPVAPRLALPAASVQLSPGWYADPTDPRALCWWDGRDWHPNTKHYAGPQV
jgi:Protein of unknown function (DUF2510)